MESAAGPGATLLFGAIVFGAIVVEASLGSAPLS